MRHHSQQHRSVRPINLPLATAASIAIGQGCLERPVVPVEPQITNVTVEKVTQTKVEAIDLLFMIDNSISMADKQAILAEAVPDLVRRLIDPVCVHLTSGIQERPVGGECPEGFAREFEPVTDIHVGVLSSSMGSFGAVPAWSPEHEEEATDNGRLVAGRPRAAHLGIGEGFLAWVPGVVPDELDASFQQLVRAVGEHGSGYEASLESWFHFLVDPAPWTAIQTVPCEHNPSYLCAQKVAVPDAALLAERQRFLRPDSLLAIVMLSDENDCSIRPEGMYYYPARIQGADAISMPRASAACASDPNDPCCYSCTQSSPPQGCAPDPSCASEPTLELSGPADDPNLRCLRQK